MYRNTEVTETFADLTPEQLADGLAWFAVNAVDYNYQENELWIKVINPTPEQVDSLTDALENGFTPPVPSEGE